MGVLDGQPVSAAITNPAFINKNQDDVMGNILGFNRAGSGASIADIQAAVNKLYTTTGASESQTGTVYSAPANTITDGDSHETALSDLAQKFDPATGHMHTGNPGDAPPISGGYITGVPLSQFTEAGATLTSITGSSYNVTSVLVGESPSSGSTDPGIIVTPIFNKVLIYGGNAGTLTDQIHDSIGNVVYGRITESTGTWTLSFYSLVAGFETAYSFATPTTIDWFYRKLFNPMSDTPVYDYQFQDFEYRSVVSVSASGGAKLYGDVQFAVSGSGMSIQQIGQQIIFSASGGGGGTTSPLTTKGDLYGYDTDNARIPVGADTALLTADSAQSLGVKWETPLSTATASRVMSRDANSNTQINNSLEGYTTTATAAGTTTLTVASTFQQFFTGTTTQDCVLPVTSTLVLGQSFLIVNLSTDVVTVKSSGGNTIQAMAPNTQMLVTCILTSGTGTASWNATYQSTSILAPVNPTVQSFTSGSGTYTTPVGVQYLKIKMIGGGGGGAGSGTAAAGGGGAGGNTTFGSSLLTANGGSGGNFTNVGGQGGTATVNSPALKVVAMSGGTGAPAWGGTDNATVTQFANGGNGAAGAFGGEGGGGSNSNGDAAKTNSGSGGGGAGTGNTQNSFGGGGGGAGGYIEAIIAAPSGTYSYAIGAAGTAGTAGTNGNTGGAGAAGYIEVTEYYSNISISSTTSVASGTYFGGPYSGSNATPSFKAFRARTFQSFSSGSGTYTTPAGALYLRVRLVGGGGGGGGVSGAAAAAGGGGGGAGGYVETVISSPSGSYSYAIGAAGTAGANTGGNGGNGGNTTFSSLTGSGGTGGNGSTSTNGAGMGGPGGAASGGDINAPGAYGSPGGIGIAATNNGSAGNGGSSFFGGGGRGTAGGSDGNGADGSGFGAGGGGAAGATRLGGAGTIGFIIVEEFYQ